MTGALPDRTEAAAVACESLAAILERGATPSHLQVQDATISLEWVPLTHPERDPIDRVLDMVARVRSGVVAVDELRVLAAALRAGRAKMLATGWTKTLAGCP